MILIYLYFGLFIAAIDISYRREDKIGIVPQLVLSAILWPVAAGFIITHEKEHNNEQD